MNELFNSPFELSLRVLIILNTAQLRLTIDKIFQMENTPQRLAEKTMKKP